MNWPLVALSSIMLLIACEPRGTIDNDCTPDGKCIGQLECFTWGDRSTCRAPKSPEPKKRCVFESECFCVTCADHCEHGVKVCDYSDTSVWGAKPAVCECAP